MHFIWRVLRLSSQLSICKGSERFDLLCLSVSIPTWNSNAMTMAMVPRIPTWNTPHNWSHEVTILHETSLIKLTNELVKVKLCNVFTQSLTHRRDTHNFSRTELRTVRRHILFMHWFSYRSFFGRISIRHSCLLCQLCLEQCLILFELDYSDSINHTMHKLPTYKPAKCILKCNVHDSENIFCNLFSGQLFSLQKSNYPPLER